MKVDPQRELICQELHARPYVRFTGPAHVFHFAFLTGPRGDERDRASLERLKKAAGLEATHETARHAIHRVHLAGLGLLVVSWERHSEYVAYTFFLYELETPFRPFALALSEIVPSGFPESDAPPLVAVRLAVGTRNEMTGTPEALSQMFEGRTINGSGVLDGRAEAWSAFQIHGDGFGRVALIAESVSPHSLGRTVERLLAIENFYHLTLLALPPARDVRARLPTWETRVVQEMESMRTADTLQKKRAVLDSFLTLSAELEDVRARVSSRFAASAAYFALLQNRFSELRETKIERALRLSRFVMRRVAPAAETCRSVHERMSELSHVIERAAHLLRTSIGLHVEEQNQSLLASADRRARLQLELQIAVESLSVVAIAYYLTSLVGHVLEGAQRIGLSVDREVTLAIVAPLLLVGAWTLMRVVRRRIQH